MEKAFSERFVDNNLQEIIQNPNKFGAPTFEEFKRNRQKFVGRDDDSLAIVDKGSHNLQRVVENHIYEIEGFRCKNLEEVERIAGDYGIPLRELDYRPELIPQGGGKAKMLIKFVSKLEREKRAIWE